MRILFLCCSSWVSHPVLGGIAIAIVRSDGSFALLDCGPKAPERIHTCGLDPCKLNFVLITHCHGDHVLGLPTLVMWRRFRCGKPTIIVGAKPVIDCVRNLLELTGCPYAREVELIPLEIGREVTIEGYRVMLAEARHPIYTTAARVCAEGACVAYSSDTSPCESVIEVAKGCKALIYEASGRDERMMHAIGHSTPGDAVKVARRAGVKRLILVHPGLEPIAIAGDLEGVEVIVPHECYSIDVGDEEPPTPSE